MISPLSLASCVCVCVGVCMHVCVPACVLAYPICTCGGQRSRWVSFSVTLHLIFSGRVFHQTQSSLFLLDCLASKPPGPHRSLPPTTGVIEYLHISVACSNRVAAELGSFEGTGIRTQVLTFAQEASSPQLL